MLTLTLLQTADARLLMECNNTSTDFVCIAIQQHWKLFPSTADERPPKRLRCCACQHCTLWSAAFCICPSLPPHAALLCHLTISQFSGETRVAWSRGPSTTLRTAPARPAGPGRDLHLTKYPHRRTANLSQVNVCVGGIHTL